MSENIKGYIQHGCEKYPIGIETNKIDIKGKKLFTGDVVAIENKFGQKRNSIVCTKKGQIMGILQVSLSQEGINNRNVTKIKSYKDLKNGEEFERYSLKVVLEETKQNHVENIKYIINGNTSIVILEDGSKGIAKCHPNDEFDKKEGLIRAYARANGEEIDDKGNESKVNEELWNDIINDKAVINCETKGDENILFRYLYKKGIQWDDKRDIYRNTYYSYEAYKTNTCFHIINNYDVMISSKNYYIGEGYKIITVKELFNLIPSKQLSDYTNEELLEELNKRLK
ncbi:hypothetical protein EJM73_08620 [Clostridium botulinum]|uniref:hypothetical protein n=1 Tax=Clostridium botulinum TaxID=1491 RepID=UPI0013760445|nr:hypothetical protein [Clostridium botulinum]NCI19687.1 hypothetical protein [Clostridium botulinum]NCI35725.1 hypothetical protein [Clostridium botulinum]NCI71582.1 hypothetical protein [Clostridium botulinum]NDI38774.1 hypothetical protein [Clostridium botulinum]